MNVLGADKRIVQQEIMNAANKKFGNIYYKINEGQLDLIMLSLPGGTLGDWVAYAHGNGWMSVYNNLYCTSLSIQVHEVGHNFGLYHSGHNNKYDDLSGIMGYSSKSDESPLKCFNVAKSWQLGWYSDGHMTITPFELNSEKINSSGRLLGVAGYDLLDVTSTNKVIVRIIGYDVDYYVSFNVKKVLIQAQEREAIKF